MTCIEDRPDAKNLGRMYIEALHLKDFLKAPETIMSERIDALAREYKRSWNTSQSSNAHLTDGCHLSQAFLGGFEGKRTRLLKNSLHLHAKQEPNTFDKALDALISSEINQLSLQRAMRLHDQSTSTTHSFSDDYDLKQLMNLVKPPHPRLDSFGCKLFLTKAADKTIAGQKMLSD